MRDNNKKDHIRALVGTMIFHVVLALLFLLFGLSTPLPLPEEEGVLVALGYTDAGQGRVQPLVSSPPLPRQETAPPSSAPEEIVTQQTEESVRLPDATPKPVPERQDPESPQRETQPVPETPVEKPREEPQPQVDPRALFPGVDQRTTSRQAQGDTTGQGNQGQREGVVDAENFQGIGQGQGVTFSLSNRRANLLPVPEYTTQAQGRVVVNITVNRQGQVTRATAGGRGSTTTDRNLYRLAEEAARRARFDVQQNAPEEQTGTITYNFIRLN